MGVNGMSNSVFTSSRYYFVSKPVLSSSKLQVCYEDIGGGFDEVHIDRMVRCQSERIGLQGKGTRLMSRSYGPADTGLQVPWPTSVYPKVF
jgi:hypothetical protein